MASPREIILAEAEQLVADLKADSSSPLEHAKILERIDRIRCRFQTGLDSLLYHARPVQFLLLLEAEWSDVSSSKYSRP